MKEQKKNWDLDLYTLVKDVLKNWWVILSLALSAALVSYIQADRSYYPTYTIEATYVVTTKGVNNTAYTNLTTAKETASRFSQIINSATLMSKVAEELGTGGVPGNVSASVIPETNLMNLTVTAKSPELAFKILKAVMNNYPLISEYLVGNAILEVLLAPGIPTQPNQSRNTSGPMKKAFVYVAAAVTAVLAVFSYLKDTIRKASDVESKLDTRYLGSLCHERKRKSPSLLITRAGISFRYVEMVNKICRKVQNRMEQNGAKTLLVTSYLENEGKSTVTANLALALAQNGKKVVLMDLDLRKPSQYKIFDLFDQEKSSFGEVLCGEKNPEAPIIDYLKEKDIYTIFNTEEYVRSSEMLTTGALKVIFDFLKEKFDYVIIDTPPMAFVSDTEEIANMADASLVVVREHVANARDINDMLDVLNGCQAAPVGCVFNDVHGSVGAALFGGSTYGYGYGYGKGYGKYEQRN